MLNKIKSISFLLIITVLGCTNDQYYQEIFKQSSENISKAMKIDSLNQILATEIDDSAILELSKNSNSFYNTVDSIYYQSIMYSRGFRFTTNGKPSTKLANPENTESTQQIQNENGFQIIIKSISNHHVISNKLIKQFKNEDLKLWVNQEYSSMLERANSLEGLEASEFMLALSKIIVSEKRIIQEILREKKAVDNSR